MGDGEHGPSWRARMIALRDCLGPFHLAYLETILRAADMRASRAESELFSDVDYAVQGAAKSKET
jgi:CRISPR-associated endonuclease/helicase Cas3